MVGVLGEEGEGAADALKVEVGVLHKGICYTLICALNGERQ